MLVDEYRNNDYEVQIKDLHKFTGSDLKDNKFQRQLEPLREQPPPEQSIMVRGRGAPRKPDNEGTEAQVKARKNAREKYEDLKLPIESRGGAAGRYIKSPVKRGIKDLE